MFAIRCIAADLTVRQVAGASPACAALLETYPRARDGSIWSLQELGPFARDNELDPMRLLNDLANASGLPLCVSERAKSDQLSPMPLIFTALIVGLSLGAAWGVGLLLRIAWGTDFAAVPARSVHVHGVAQLWGWLALFVFAVGSHLLRQNTKWPAPQWLDHATGASVVAGLLIFIASTSVTVRDVLGGRGEIIASLLLAAGAGSFAISVTWSVLGRRQRPQISHWYIFAMIAWLLIWSCADIAIRIGSNRASAPSDVARTLLIVLPVLGFATNAIYGFAIRLIPGLLNIGLLRPRCFAITLALHNIGFVLLLTPMRSTRALGSVLMLAAAICYLIGMDLLRSKPSRTIWGVDTRGHILIRISFAWLLIGLGMVVVQHFVQRDLPHPYTGAWRHALTVGFITTMILGVGHRIIPIFIRQPLASNRLMLISAALIVAGNAARVTLELLTIGRWPWAFRLMGITGVLELSALILFACNLALTWRNRRRVYRGIEQLTANTRVREAVNERPHLQRRLRELGITMFDAAPFIAPSLTFGALALAWGLSPDDLVGQLDEDGAEAPLVDLVH